MHYKRFYIRRQTNAGPNKGKWRVHRPDGLSVALGQSKGEAMAICEAFNVAARKATADPSLLGIQNGLVAVQVNSRDDIHDVQRRKP